MPMPKLRYIPVVVALAALVSASHANAALVTYTLNGTGAATTTDPGVSASAFAVVDSVNDGGGTTDSGISGSTNMAFIRSEATLSNATTAYLDDDDYMSFTVTPLGAKHLDLTSLVFDFGGSSGVAGYSVTTYVQTSVGGFGSAAPVVASFSKTLAASTGGTPSLTTGLNVDLSGPAFQGLTGPFVVRLYFSDNANSTGEIARVDNVILNGISVPSPAALPAGLMLITLAAAKRRRGA